jgi:hypothetical protein
MAIAESSLFIGSLWKECAAVAQASDVGRCQVRRLIIPANELIGAANRWTDA